jgi:sec-independent protein translocase protein TatB
MLDIGWSELALVALLALIVIGPKDLPAVMRGLGQWTRKARLIARDFQSSLDEMMHESELDEARKTVERARNFNPQSEVERELDPDGSVKETARDLDDTARRAGRAEESDTAATESAAGETPAAERPASDRPGAEDPGGGTPERESGAGAEDRTAARPADDAGAPGNGQDAAHGGADTTEGDGGRGRADRRDAPASGTGTSG